MNKLRSGYTTGTYATAVLVACLYEYFEKRVVDTLEVVLPKNIVAIIEVSYEKHCCFSTIKGDNDDLDVTKGAKIFCTLQAEIPKDLKNQTASLLSIGSAKIYVWAGDGVGVVTKKGLKISPNHPAINPTPLKMMQENSFCIIGQRDVVLHAIFSVEHGEKIAKETANAKVGVLGGISILGTHGIVKPISATAYIESIKTEINVAYKNTNTIIFTLGNSAYERAKTLFENISIVEIGNFVYDALCILKNYNFKKILFITSSAKMTKVAQGFKNTHNRFGSIDFELIKIWLERLGYIYESNAVTLKAILDELQSGTKEDFLEFVTQKALQQIEMWLDEERVIYEELEVFMLHDKMEVKSTFIKERGW